jgi:PAS domain S-box-containing protein
MTMIPLSSFCVAAAIAEDRSGKLIECNDLFRQLIVLEQQPDGGGETKSSTQHATALEEKTIWELVGISPPSAAPGPGPAPGPAPAPAAGGDSKPTPTIIEPQTKQIFQGPNVPNRWVRIHLQKLNPNPNVSSNDNNQNNNNNNWLLQLENIDVAERAKNQWTAILETSFDGFWDYHIPKDYEYMSPRFWEMFGYSHLEKEHKPSEWMDMVHPEDFKASMVDLQQHFGSRGEIPYIRETRYKHKDGSWVWVLCRGKVIEWDDDDTGGAPLRMIGTHTDITQSKLKALRERELYDKIEQEQKRIIAAKEELRKFVQHANAPVFGTDTHGIIDTWNDRMEQITKIPHTAVLGLPLQGSPVQAAQTMVQQALEGNESTNGLLRVRLLSAADDEKKNDSTDDTSSLRLLINTTTRRNLTDGGVLGCVCFGLDLTEIQLSQEQLLRAQERCKAEKQLNEFVAHEVRNPLAAAISASAFIKDTLMKDTTRRVLPGDMQQSMEEDVVVVIDSLEYIHQLLTSMLDLNKFLEQGVTLSPRLALLRRDIVDPVYRLYNYRSNELKVTTEVWWRKGDDGLLRVANEHDKTDDQRIRVDVVRLKQILINLISNSIKFTKEGFVRVRVGRFDAKSPDKLSILVEDSGPGIPKEKRKLLFEKYVQLSKQIQGSGIGLALTRQLVHAMKGTIEIDEHYQSGIPGNPGTRFVVHIVVPLVAEDPAAGEDCKPQIVEERKIRFAAELKTQNTNPTGSKLPGGVVTLEETIDSLHHHRDELSKSQRIRANGDHLTTAISGFETANLRVLVVDDDKIIRKLLTRRLTNIDKSMIVEQAESGEIAIEKITGTNAQKYDLVLMDHFMPLCGGELTGEETIRIIRPHIEGVIAGSSGNDMSKEHAAAGADLFWLKPVPKDHVLLDDLREAFKLTRCNGNDISGQLM